MWRTALILLFYVHFPSYADDVIWLPNKSINVASNFEDEMLPCSRQIVIFPDSVQESVRVAGLSVSGLILPFDGEIILEDGVLALGGDPNDNCTRKGFSSYKDNLDASWEQPDAWISKRFNKATPDAERVPCAFDVAIFPENAQFTVKLPDFPQSVQKLKVGGEFISKRQLQDRIMAQNNDQSQQFVYGLGGQNFRVRPDNRQCYSTTRGCPCQDFELNIDCKMKYCPPVQCSHPIKPRGHCCELCGASLVLDIENDFKIIHFMKLVEDVISSYGSEKFEYHAGILPYYNADNYELGKFPVKVQVIVLDKNEYTGTSLAVVTDINHKLSEEFVKEKVLLLSGSPNSESSQTSKIVVSGFFMVVFMMGGLFAYYYRESRINLRDLRFGMPRGVLSRLRERTDSIVSLARRDSTVSTTTTTGTAFRNPLYSSMRERVQVVESVIEE